MPIYKFSAESTIAGSNKCVNVWHVYAGSTTPTTAQQSALLAPFKAFYDALNPDRPPGVQVTIGTSQTIFDVAAWVPPVGRPGLPGYVPGHFTTPPTIGTGTQLLSSVGSGSAAGPPQVAVVASWKTALAGRSYRGRTYVGNLSGSDTVTLTVPGAFQSRIQTAGNALIPAVAAVTVGSGTPSLVVWSPTRGVYTNILSCAVDTTYDTMRSRVR